MWQNDLVKPKDLSKCLERATATYIQQICSEILQFDVSRGESTWNLKKETKYKACIHKISSGTKQPKRRDKKKK